MLSCVFSVSMGRPPEGGVQKLMMSSLLCLLFFDTFSDHACVFLCVSMYLKQSCWHTKQYQRNVEWWRKSGCQHNTTKHLTRVWRTDRTCVATRRRTGLNHLSQHLRHWFPARDNQVSGPVSLRETTRLQGYTPFFSLQSLHCTSQDMRSEKHCTSPSFVCTTHESESVRQPGQSTTSIESSKVKNPNPMLQLIQHHLALLHASSWGNDRVGSSDLLDSGGWVPRSLQVHHLWFTGGQRGAHPWDHIDGPRGHFHKKL